MAKVIVVSHTHWDREWYLPFEKFRYQLVRLVDKLLTILRKDKRYRHFLLDGQAVLAEDYLEIRPENEARFREEVAKGRIGIGPWYTMPDEFLAGGEAIVRNLLMGHKLGRKLGGVMKIGYLPDPFGHVAQMPQILRGFGIDCAFLARGVDPLQTEFYWEAPDGSRVLTHWFAAGYCNASLLPPEPEKFARGPFRGLNSLLDFLLAKASTDTILLMNGCDHMGPQDDLPQALEALNQKLGHNFVHGTLREFASRVRQCNPKLETIRGELRKVRFAPLLPGVLSSRIYLKQRNHAVQTLLTAYAEPVAAFAWSIGEEYPAAFLEWAWRLVLKNHFHDSICGSSVDQVHREMMPRFDRAEQIAEEITEDYLKRIGRQIAIKDEGIPLLVFNPTPYRQTGKVRVWVEPRKEVPRGKGRKVGGEDFDLDKSTLFDSKGNSIPFQIDGRRLFSYDILNGAKHIERIGLTFVAKDIPPFGYRVYLLRTSGPKPPQGSSLLRGERKMENEFYEVEVNDDGTLTVLDKESGVVYRNLGYFEDSGDAGDEYDYSPPDSQEVLNTQGLPAEIEVAEDEPDWATIRIHRLFHLPEGLSPDRRARAKEKVTCEITSYVTLQRGVRRIEIRTVVDNRARDHRLRVAFPTGIHTEESIAESAFAVVRRPVALPQDFGPVESPAPTHPQERFVAVEGKGQGLAIINKGLPEYEVTEDGIIYLTLLRCIGWLSRDDLKTRRGHAGLACRVPEAQCLGQYTFEYALVPYAGSWLQAGIWKEAEAFTRPLRATRIEGGGNLPLVHSFLEIEPEELLVSAVKKAEDDEALVVRLWNISTRQFKGSLTFHRCPAKAFETDLNEGEKAPLEIEGGHKVGFQVRGCEIKTLKLVF